MMVEPPAAPHTNTARLFSKTIVGVMLESGRWREIEIKENEWRRNKNNNSKRHSNKVIVVIS